MLGELRNSAKRSYRAFFAYHLFFPSKTLSQARQDETRRDEDFSLARTRAIVAHSTETKAKHSIFPTDFDCHCDCDDCDSSRRDMQLCIGRASKSTSRSLFRISFFILFFVGEAAESVSVNRIIRGVRLHKALFKHRLAR